jgi:hypothetical protein
MPTIRVPLSHIFQSTPPGATPTYAKVTASNNTGAVAVSPELFTLNGVIPPFIDVQVNAVPAGGNLVVRSVGVVNNGDEVTVPATLTLYTAVLVGAPELAP